jgi:hypothetical protein
MHQVNAVSQCKRNAPTKQKINRLNITAAQFRIINKTKTYETQLKVTENYYLQIKVHNNCTNRTRRRA